MTVDKSKKMAEFMYNLLLKSLNNDFAVGFHAIAFIAQPVVGSNS